MPNKIQITLQTD